MQGPTYSPPPGFMTLPPASANFWDRFNDIFCPNGSLTPTGCSPSSSAATNITLGLVVGRVALYVIAISGTIFLVKLIMAGYTYLTSAGDQNMVQNATKEITNSLIGLVIVVAAYFVIQVLELIYGIKLI